MHLVNIGGFMYKKIKEGLEPRLIPIPEGTFLRVILKLCGMREKRVDQETKMAYPKPNQ